VSRLSDILRARKFAVTAEIAPPASADPQVLLDKALPLRGLADAVNVTDGAQARASMSPLAAAAILVRNDIEPILQLSCRDRNRIALQSDLLGAAALGITNVLMLRGDDPTAGDQPDTKPVFDLDTQALVQTAARMERATDQKAEGCRICVELLQQLAEIDGVAGAHVMAPLNEASLAPTLEEFRGR
jgi:methylenetetrahydrofolate reductase (NADPH)